jgi:DNA gyrase/topoisomerase IV subunit A
VRQVSEADEEVILISSEGQVVRTKLESIATRKDGSAQGVRVMTLREGDKVAGIAAFRTGLAKRNGTGDNEEEADEAPEVPKVVKAPRPTAKGGTPSKGKPVAKEKPVAKPKATAKSKPVAKGKPAPKKRSGR